MIDRRVSRNFRNMVWVLAVVALVASACSEERPAGSHQDGSAHGKGECCQFHAKKEVAEPKFVELGKAKAGEVVFTAVQVGDVKAGDWGFIQMTTDDAVPPGTKVRVWIGHEEPKQATTAEYCEGHDEWSAEVSVPATLLPDMKWWVAVEPKSGPRAVTSLPLKP
jgi:hypothetical protein